MFVVVYSMGLYLVKAPRPLVQNFILKTALIFWPNVFFNEFIMFTEGYKIHLNYISLYFDLYFSAF